MQRPCIFRWCFPKSHWLWRCPPLFHLTIWFSDDNSYGYVVCFIILCDTSVDEIRSKNKLRARMHDAMKVLPSNKRKEKKPTSCQGFFHLKGHPRNSQKSRKLASLRHFSHLLAMKNTLASVLVGSQVPWWVPSQKWNVVVTTTFHFCERTHQGTRGPTGTEAHVFFFLWPENVKMSEARHFFHASSFARYVWTSRHEFMLLSAFPVNRKKRLTMRDWFAKLA